MRKRLPKDADKVWGWLIGQDQKTLLAILAVCAGYTVDAVERKRLPPRSGSTWRNMAADSAGVFRAGVEAADARRRGQS